MSLENFLKFGGAAVGGAAIYSKIVTPFLYDPSLAVARQRFKDKFSEVTGDAIFTAGATISIATETVLHGALNNPNLTLGVLGAVGIYGAYHLSKRK